jgi:phage/plasmid-like protein (TIGR03299 family)
VHEIENNMMFSVKETPWHRLGVVLENAPNSREAIVAAKLDWLVHKGINYFPFKLPDGEIQYHNGESYTTFRIGENNLPVVLGTVSDNYEIVQNIDAFKMLDQYFIDNGYTYETAGAIRNGKVVWIMVKHPEQITVEDEKFDQYFLLTTGHDGEHKVNIKPTNIRVVCNNTLTAALRGVRLSLIHRTGVNRETRFILDNISKIGFCDVHAIYKKMMRYRIEPIQAIKYFEKVEPRLVDRDNPEVKRNVWKEMFYSLNDCFFYGDGNRTGDRKTLWHAYNAVTEYVDHIRKVGSSNELEFSQFGTGANMKIKAFDIASDVATDKYKLLEV